jgi:hypothetical protein
MATPNPKRRPAAQVLIARLAGLVNISETKTDVTSVAAVTDDPVALEASPRELQAFVEIRLFDFVEIANILRMLQMIEMSQADGQMVTKELDRLRPQIVNSIRSDSIETEMQTLIRRFSAEFGD